MIRTARFTLFRLLLALAVVGACAPIPCPAAVTDTTPRVQYVASGGASYTFAWPLWAKTDVKVYVGSTLKAVDSQYTVAFTVGGPGGTVTFTAGNVPAVGSIVTIMRELPNARTADFSITGTFRPQTLNSQLDQLTAQAQDLSSRVDRALIQPSYGTAAPPAPAPGNVIGWDASGSLANLTFPPDTGVNVTSVFKGEWYLSPGAGNQGAVATAGTLAWAIAQAGTGATFRLPAGTYTWTQAITLPEGASVLLSDGVTINASAPLVLARGVTVRAESAGGHTWTYSGAADTAAISWTVNAWPGNATLENLHLVGDATSTGAPNNGTTYGVYSGVALSDGSWATTQGNNPFVRVRNCRIEGFKVGLYLEAYGHTIEDCYIRFCQSAMKIVHPEQVLVSNCFLDYNDDGILSNPADKYVGIAGHRFTVHATTVQRGTRGITLRNVYEPRISVYSEGNTEYDVKLGDDAIGYAAGVKAFDLDINTASNTSAGNVLVHHSVGGTVRFAYWGLPRTDNTVPHVLVNGYSKYIDIFRDWEAWDNRYLVDVASTTGYAAAQTVTGATSGVTSKVKTVLSATRLRLEDVSGSYLDGVYLDVASTYSFGVGVTVNDKTSGATATVRAVLSGTRLWVRGVAGTFAPGNTLRIGTTDITTMTGVTSAAENVTNGTNVTAITLVTPPVLVDVQGDARDNVRLRTPDRTMYRRGEETAPTVTTDLHSADGQTTLLQHLWGWYGAPLAGAAEVTKAVGNAYVVTDLAYPHSGTAVYDSSTSPARMLWRADSGGSPEFYEREAWQTVSGKGWIAKQGAANYRLRADTAGRPAADSVTWNTTNLVWDTASTMGTLGAQRSSLQTTDATPTAVATIPLSANTAYSAAVVCLGDTSTHSARAMYRLTGLVYRAGAGAAQQGATVDNGTVESAAAWDCTLGVSGNNLVVTATGAAATTINWTTMVTLEQTP
jgi:hypothetical protein